MLGVLTAQSADEPTPFAPRDRPRVHGATDSPTRELASEELPSLPNRTTATLAPLAKFAGVATELAQSVTVVRDQLTQPGLERELERGLDRREVTVLDERFEFAASADRDLGRRLPGGVGLAQHRSKGVGPAAELALGPKPLEVGEVVVAEADSQEPVARPAAWCWHFV